MKNQMVFKRYEMKYLLNASQYHRLKSMINNYMIEDSHGKSTILSLYLDTPDYLLIRRSMDKPLYKEKVRLRSYGITTNDGTVFLELKKKYDSVVYKRREEMTLEEFQKFLYFSQKPKDTQIIRELDYTLSRYPNLEPRMLLTYDREAFYGNNDHDFRMTFDQNIQWSSKDLSLKHPVIGTQLLDHGQVLLEIKVANALPLWLVKALEELHLTKTSFSKYATAYQEMLAQNKLERENQLKTMNEYKGEYIYA